MSFTEASASDVEKWLHRLKPDWMDIEVDPLSVDGNAIYKLVRCGLAEAISRFVAWHPECDFEAWTDATIGGRWNKAEPTAAMRNAFGDKMRPRVVQALYTAIRFSPSVKRACSQGDAARPCEGRAVEKVTGEFVLSAPPVDRQIEFSETTKRVARILLFYSRVGFAPGTRTPVPLDSTYEGLPLQGAAAGVCATLWNVAEFEPVDAVFEPFRTSLGIAFAFSQACFRCSEVIYEVLSLGKRGDIPPEGAQVGKLLGDAYSAFHHAGQYVLRLYHRHGRNCDHIAAMVSRPLSIRNVDPELLHEVEALATLDMAIFPVPPSTTDRSPSTRNAASDAAGSSATVDDVEYENILQMIRYMGRSFETTPSVYRKFDEQELRDLILNHLNGHFHGGAASERFRKQGKTDICIEFPQREAFVAECKIWRGPSECAESIDQLMSYVTSHDRRGALIFFNKDVRNFQTAVIEGTASVVQQHPLYLCQRRMLHYGEHRFGIRHKDDSVLSLDVHIFLFNLFPNPRSK